MMKKTILILILSTIGIQYSQAQDNCNVFLWEGDSCRYLSCKYLDEAPGYFQLRREYHEIKDKAIEICPEYSLPYKHKSTSYLKTGDFINWKKLIDKAVKLNPEKNLDYRGWCRFQFFRDYEGAIKDIETLDSLVNYDIGFCQNGDYHLNVAKGLCYKMLGQKAKAIQIIESQMESDSASIGLYDYLHLGVLYLEEGQPDHALELFSKQLDVNELAEAYYYRAMALEALDEKDEARRTLQQAKDAYLSSKFMLDIYTHHVDKVFLKEINNALSKY